MQSFRRRDARPLLSDARIHRSMALSIVEGVGYAAMVGLAETYFVADAVRLGATALELGLLVGLPFAVGGLGSFLGLFALRAARRRKPMMVASVAMQAAVLFALALAGTRLSPALLIAAVALYQVLGQHAGTVWSSWYGDLVPGAERGRYFARRSKAVQLTTFLAMVAGGVILQQLEPGGRPALDGVAGGSGFAVLYAAGGLFRLICAGLLAVSPEPPFRGIRRPQTALKSLLVPSGRPTLRLLSLAALLSFGVYLSAAFFNPYMLKELRLDYLEFMVALATQVAFKVVSLGAFGLAVDRYGSNPVFRLSALLVAVIPFPWVLVRGPVGVWSLQAFAGFAWAGYELGLFTLLLEHSRRRTRPQVFALQSLANGTAQLLGSVLGALLLQSARDGYLFVFFVSAAARTAVALAVPRFLAPLEERARIGRGHLLLRVIGMRPSGGLVHRPIGDPPSQPVRSEPPVRTGST